VKVIGFLQKSWFRLGKSLEMKFKIILDKRHPKRDNTCPLKLRIYEGNGYKESSLKIFLADGEWDDDSQTVLKNCKSHQLYNSKLHLPPIPIVRVKQGSAPVASPPFGRECRDTLVVHSVYIFCVEECPLRQKT
jgi:hypothetical protein